MEPADNIGRATQSKRLKGGRGKRGGIAFVTQNDPLYVGTGRFGDSGVTVRMKSPLEVIALDNEGRRDFPIATPLKLGSDIDEKRAALGGRIGIRGFQPQQRGASVSEILVQRIGSQSASGHSAMVSPEPPTSLGKSLNLGRPSRMGSTDSV